MAYFDTEEKAVYHACENCSTGKAIPPSRRRAGIPAGADECAECENLEMTKGCGTVAGNQS